MRTLFRRAPAWLLSTLLATATFGCGASRPTRAATIIAPPDHDLDADPADANPPYVRAPIDDAETSSRRETRGCRRGVSGCLSGQPVCTYDGACEVCSCESAADVRSNWMGRPSIYPR